MRLQFFASTTNLVIGVVGLASLIAMVQLRQELSECEEQRNSLISNTFNMICGFCADQGVFQKFLTMCQSLESLNNVFVANNLTTNDRNIADICNQFSSDTSNICSRVNCN